MKKNEIIICQGSSCFSRGNRENLKAIQTYISSNNLSIEIGFKGQLCTSNCQQGPVILINNKVFSDINTGNVIGIITRELAL